MAKINFETPRNILLDIKHDFTYVNNDSFKSDIEKDHSYSKSQMDIVVFSQNNNIQMMQAGRLK